MKKHLQLLTPAALYVRVSSDRQDVDEAESGRVTGRAKAGNVPTVTVASPNHGIMKRAQGQAMHITAANGSRLTSTS